MDLSDLPDGIIIGGSSLLTYEEEQKDLRSGRMVVPTTKHIIISLSSRLEHQPKYFVYKAFRMTHKGVPTVFCLV